MNCYEITDGIVRQINVTLAPYPNITLGEGGHKSFTRVALGKRDAESIIEKKMVPCPNQGQYANVWATAPSDPKVCNCGAIYGPWEPRFGYFYALHPKSGEVVGSSVVKKVGVIALKDATDKPTGKYLIVAPREGADDRVLVLWRFPSGYRGSASITPGVGVVVLGTDSAWHSGQGNIGETAEILAILKPGQELRGSRSGRRLEDTRGWVRFDGSKVFVKFGGEELFAAESTDIQGDYI